MAEQELSRGELQDLVAKQALSNPKYRAALISDPKSLLGKQLGAALPGSMKVVAIQDTADTYHVVVPYAAAEGAELGDADLEKVAGGLGDKNSTCIASALSTQVNLNL